MARRGWKSVTFFQDCFIEPLLWARASARREWDAASRPCREQPLCMSRRASSLPPLGPISPSPRSPAREGSRRTRAPAQVGRASLCLGWASRERPCLRSPIRASPGARTAPSLQAQPLWGPFPFPAPGPCAQVGSHRWLLSVRCALQASGSLCPLHLKVALRALGRSEAAQVTAHPRNPLQRRRRAAEGAEEAVESRRGAVGRASQSVLRGSGFSLCSF